MACVRRNEWRILLFFDISKTNNLSLCFHNFLFNLFFSSSYYIILLKSEPHLRDFLRVVYLFFRRAYKSEFFMFGWGCYNWLLNLWLLRYFFRLLWRRFDNRFLLNLLGLLLFLFLLFLWRRRILLLLKQETIFFLFFIFLILLFLLLWLTNCLEFILAQVCEILVIVVFH